MQLDRSRRAEALASFTNQAKIVQSALTSHHALVFHIIPEQQEISPQGAAQKSNAILLARRVDHDFAIIEKMYTIFLRRYPHLGQHLQTLCTIEFMVPRHIDDFFIREGATRPKNAIRPLADVTSKNDHIGIGLKRFER